MREVGFGDLARGFRLLRRTAELKAALDRASSELTTGRRADPAAALRGDLSVLAGIGRDLARLGAVRANAADAATRAEAMQTALGLLQERALAVGSRLLSVPPGGPPAQVDATGAEARAAFGAAVGALNLRIADRSLFAGAATGGPALAPAEDILAALEAATAGETTAAGLAAAVDAWFAAPPGGGGFLDSAYLGSTTPPDPVPLGEGEAADLAITAADPAIRAGLAGLAMAALLGRGALAGDAAARDALGRAAGERLVAADGGLIALQARLGDSEARIARAATRAEVEGTALRLAETALLEADPYEAAARLTEAETRLQSLYLVTARLSRLSLAEYLR